MKGSAVSNGRSTELQRGAASPLDTHGLNREDLLRAYRTMVLSRRIDDKEIQLKNQSLIFFQISGAGHEAILVAAGMQLKPAYDWFYPYYRDRALCLAIGMTAYEMLLAGSRVEGRPGVGRPADAVALGTQAAQHRVAVEPDRHAVPPGHRLRGSLAPLREDHGDRRPRVALPSRRGHLRLGRRRLDERRRVLGVAQLGVPRSPARRLRRRRQRLRDLGSRRGADGRRRHLPARLVVPGPPGPEHRWDRLSGELSRHVGRDCLRPRPQGAGARARQGHPAILALALGRRKALQDLGRAGGRVDPRSNRQARRTAQGRATRDRRGPRRDSPRRRPRSARRRRTSHPRAQADG